MRRFFPTILKLAVCGLLIPAAARAKPKPDPLAATRAELTALELPTPSVDCGRRCARPR